MSKAGISASQSLLPEVLSQTGREASRSAWYHGNDYGQLRSSQTQSEVLLSLAQDPLAYDHPLLVPIAEPHDLYSPETAADKMTVSC